MMRITLRRRRSQIGVDMAGGRDWSGSFPDLFFEGAPVATMSFRDMLGACEEIIRANERYREADYAITVAAFWDAMQAIREHR